jgi:hypothetical protein
MNGSRKLLNTKTYNHRQMRKQVKKTAHTWRIPVLLSLLTIIGLLSALLGTGPWRVFSWIVLSIPVIILFKSILLPGKIKND